MRNDICFVAVGQCGGNNGLLFEKLGYDVFYINTAREDINTLKGAKHTYVTPGTKGCNQDADKAKAVLGKYFDDILAKVSQFATKKFVYFISSAGGGTSAMTPLLMEAFMDKLREEFEEAYDRYEENGEEGEAPVHRKVGLITFLPSISESAHLNANAFMYLRDVNDLVLQSFGGDIQNMASVFLVDNENNRNKLTLNEEFVSAFHDIMLIPEKHHHTLGNVDAADLETGFAVHGVCTLAKLDKGCGEEKIVNAIKHSSIFADTEDAVTHYWISSTTRELKTIEIEKELGMPDKHFFTFNREAEYFVASGMSFPKARLQIMAERAKEYQQTLKVMSKNLANSVLDADLSFMNEPFIIKVDRTERKVNSNKTAIINTKGEFEVKESQEIPKKPTSTMSAKDKLKMFKKRGAF